MALHLHPKTERVAVITDMTRTGRALKRKADAVFRDFSSRLEFRYLEDLTIVLVLLDMTMPELGGAEAYTELRRIRPDVRVILMSGYNEQDSTNRFAGRGPAGFVQKPLQVATLARTIRRVLSSPLERQPEESA